MTFEVWSSCSAAGADFQRPDCRNRHRGKRPMWFPMTLVHPAQCPTTWELVRRTMRQNRTPSAASDCDATVQDAGCAMRQRWQSHKESSPSARNGPGKRTARVTPPFPDRSRGLHGTCERRTRSGKPDFAAGRGMNSEGAQMAHGEPQIHRGGEGAFPAGASPVETPHPRSGFACAHVIDDKVR